MNLLLEVIILFDDEQREELGFTFTRDDTRGEGRHMSTIDRPCLTGQAKPRLLARGVRGGDHPKETPPPQRYDPPLPAVSPAAPPPFPFLAVSLAESPPPVCLKQ